MNGFIEKYKRNNWTIIFVLAAYSALIIACCHYERLTADTTLYISIAEKYIRGDFGNAINGYWGPLLSWLLIPFLALGASHVFAVNALNLIFGWLTVIGVQKLARTLEIHDNLIRVILLPLVPILLFISLIQPMDYLLLCVLIYYLNFVFSKEYPTRLSYAAFSGILGAFAYFSKPYGFPFFVSHFLLINACHYFMLPSKEHRKNVARNILVGFLFFSLLSGVWISLISAKYNHITFSNMGRGVFASLGPGSEHKTLEKGDPIFFEGFFEPPNDTAFVIYEDPSYARTKTWSPLTSGSALTHFMSNFSANIFEGLRIYEAFSRLSIAIIITYILLICFQPPGTLFLRGDFLYPLLTILLYTGGYLTFHFETRYLWIVNILLLLMGGKVLSILFQTEFFRKPSMKNILALLFVLSFMLTPLRSSLTILNNNINKDMQVLGTELKSRYNIRGNIASNRQKINTEMHDSWHYTFRLAYWLKSRYFGMPRENISDEDLQREFKKHDIDYYFFWGKSNNIPQFLSQYKEITNSEMPGLKIYALKKAK
jgi:hypothetical protein